MQHRQLLLAILLLPLSLSIQAGDKEDLLVPPPPPKLKSGEVIEPEVNIIKRKDATEEQYSVNGQVYAVKITPTSGPAYYLIDTDGDGVLETLDDDFQRNLSIPQWVLFSW